MTTATSETQAAPAATRSLPLIADCCTGPSTVSDDDAVVIARMFKALADPARVKILSMLMKADEVCACDFSASIDRTAATTSHHLKLLREAGLITGDKRGTWVWYRVVPERVAALRDALTMSNTR
jgi:ArsR family transcriptional regulator